MIANLTDALLVISEQATRIEQLRKHTTELKATIKKQNNEYIESCFNMQVKHDAEILSISTGKGADNGDV